MTSILDFLNLKAFGKSPSVGTEIVGEYAKEAAHNYLNNGVPLNDSIIKISQASALTPEQVEMVIWETNKRVHSAKFASQEDKCIDFPLADPAVIMPSLQVQRPAGVKLASAFSNDFELPPPPKEGMYRDFEMCKTASGMHEGLTGEGALPLKYRMKDTIEKLAVKQHDLEADIAIAQDNIHKGEITFLKEARAAIIDYPFHKRLEAFATLAKVASHIQMKPAYRSSLMGKLAQVLIRQGLLEKTASIEQYVSDEIADKCQVINGNNRLYILIKTLKDEVDRRENLQDTWNVVRTDRGILDERVRLL